MGLNASFGMHEVAEEVGQLEEGLETVPMNQLQVASDIERRYQSGSTRRR